MRISYLFKSLFLFILFTDVVIVCLAQKDQNDSQQTALNNPSQLKSPEKKKAARKRNKGTTGTITSDSSKTKKSNHKKTIKSNKKKLLVDSSTVTAGDVIFNNEDMDDDMDDSILVTADTAVNFKKIVSLKIADSIIRGDLAYPSYTINKLNILNAVVEKKAIFPSAHFTDAVRFRNVRVFGETQFMNARFDSGAKFERTRFHKMARFKGAIFLQDASFGNAKFFADAKFDNSTFLGAVEFRNTNFSGLANFSYARFRKKCLMTSLETNDNTELRFRNTVFPDTVVFAYNYRNFKEIDFTTADFTDTSRFDYNTDTVKPTYIFLYKTDISKLRLDYVHFKLLLPDSTINNLNRKKFISIDEKESMYEALLNNFKAHGQQESYKLCDIEYQTFRWKHSWGKWFVWLPRWWWNFGYDRQLIFSRTLLLISIFTLITYFFIYYLNSEVYRLENVPVDARWQKKFSLQDFGNRLWYSLIYTSTIFFKLTLQVDKVNFQKKPGTAYLISVYIVGLICLAYMANYVLQK